MISLLQNKVCSCLNLSFELNSKDKYPHLLSVKNCFIRGSVVRYVRLPAEEIDHQLLQDTARKEAESNRTNAAA